MKIALVSPEPVPPVYGGMNRLLEGLCEALRTRHRTDLITLPCDERSTEGILRAYHDFYHLDLSAYHRVISYKAPAYMLNHPNHVVYLSHRLRVFYDLFEPRDRDHEKLRDLIHWMDAWALDPRRIPHLFTVGETVCKRLREFGNIDSTPLNHPTTFRPIPPQKGEYFLSVGRLHPWKRIDLIIRAFLKTQIPCPLRIVGTGPQEQELHALAGGDSRIEFVGYVSESDLCHEYAHALATIFPPINEDMGLITFESFLAGKPVLTTTDSGEPAVIVEEGKTGVVSDPDPDSLARRMEWIWAHRPEMESMGKACIERMKEIDWDRVVDPLLEAGDEIESRGQVRPLSVGSSSRRPAQGRKSGGDGKIRLLVTDNQIIDPPLGGGRIRILELYRHLPEDFTTTYVGTFDYPGPAFRDQQLTPNFREILTPLTVQHFKIHGLLSRLTRNQATLDVTMPLLGGLTPRYRRLMQEHVLQADLLICAHPWMFPFLPSEPRLPRIYDSQNCEAAVKGPLLDRTLTGRYLASRVRKTERRAALGSRLILACSDEDAQAFHELYGVQPENVRLVPNGVDCRVIVPPDDRLKEDCRAKLGVSGAEFAIFVGSNYVPNLEAVEFIVSQMAPELPDVQFGIIGGAGSMFKERHPDRSLPENVRLFGFVKPDELWDFYRAADLALNPMAKGSGTNIKMLDYMAAGLPILTTLKGARGILGVSGEHWMTAPLDGFVSELQRLASAKETMRKIGEHGRSLVESRYDWSRIAESLAESLRPLARRG